MLSYIFNDNAAVRLGADGIGSDLVVILQCRVDHMTLVGVHGLQRGAAARLQNLLGYFACIAAQGFLPLLTVFLRVHIDAEMTL